MKIRNTFFLLFFCVSCSNTPKTENKILKHDSVLDSAQGTAQVNTNNVPEIISNPDSLDASGIEFGFSDKEGKQLLLLSDSLSDPIICRFTVTSKGQSAPIKFLKKKKPTSADNGRQTYFNFENCGGYLFEITGQTVDNEHSVIFMTPRFVADRTFYEINKNEKKELPAAIRKKVEADRKRKIKNFSCLTEIDNNRSVYIFEFETKKDSALAALAYVTPDKIIYNDYPALYDETSTWRVDDGGNFNVNDFSLIAVFEKDGKIEFVTDWPGEESIATEYLKEEGNGFKSLKTASRYCAPE